MTRLDHGPLGLRLKGSLSTIRRRAAISETVSFAELGDQVVLLNTDTGAYLLLNSVASRIWHLLVVGAAEEEVLQQILLEYDSEPDRVRADLVEFMRVLEANGLATSVER